MAPPLGSAKPGDLLPRLISAVVLAPVVVAAAWVGAPFLPALAVVAAALMGWEWGRLIEGGRFDRLGQLLVAGEVLSAFTPEPLAERRDVGAVHTIGPRRPQQVALADVA